MSNVGLRYKSIVLTRRIKSPGVLETMTEQVPEVHSAFAALEEQLHRRLAHLGSEEWEVVSHSHNIYNGILIMSVMVQRS